MVLHGEEGDDSAATVEVQDHALGGEKVSRDGARWWWATLELKQRPPARGAGQAFASAQEGAVDVGPEHGGLRSWRGFPAGPRSRRASGYVAAGGAGSMRRSSASIFSAAFRPQAGDHV
jgi:hypothetical protein